VYEEEDTCVSYEEEDTCVCRLLFIPCHFIDPIHEATHELTLLTLLTLRTLLTLLTYINILNLQYIYIYIALAPRINSCILLLI